MIRHAIIVLVTLLFQSYVKGSTFADQRRLHKYLLVNMDDKVRPVFNQSKPIVVDIRVILMAILGLNEKEQLLKSTVALACRWKYETLTWNESEYGGITKVNISPRDSWIPDLTLRNSVENVFILTESVGGKVEVESNGDATWYTGGTVRTSCNIDTSKYPFDIQTCKLEIGKLGFDREMSMTAAYDDVVTLLYEENGEWNLKNTKVQSRSMFNAITFLEIHLTLARNSLFYNLNVIIPVALLSFMTVLSFKVPPACGERLSYNIALLLSFFVLFNGINESMPKVSNHVPYLHVYVIYQLIMAVVITAFSIMLVNMSSTNKTTDLPLIAKLLSQCYFISKTHKTPVMDCMEETFKRSRSKEQHVNNVDSELQREMEPMKTMDRLMAVDRLGDVLLYIFTVQFILSTSVLVLCVLI